MRLLIVGMLTALLAAASSARAAVGEDATRKLYERVTPSEGRPVLRSQLALATLAREAGVAGIFPHGRGAHRDAAAQRAEQFLARILGGRTDAGSSGRGAAV